MTDLLILLVAIALVLAFVAARRRHQQLHDRAVAYERWEAWQR